MINTPKLLIATNLIPTQSIFLIANTVHIVLKAVTYYI